MRTAVVSLTRRGGELAVRLAGSLGGDAYVKLEYLPELEPCSQAEGAVRRERLFAVPEGFTAFAGTLFGMYDGIVFVMACGIVVRAVAPYIRDKKQDPAVVVMDERGQYAISLLSGHIGGANELAVKAAETVGGVPVITTATDVSGVIAFDVVAQKNHCRIENMAILKKISARLVDGGKLGFLCDYKVEGAIPEYLVAMDNTDSQGLAVIISNRADVSGKPDKVLCLRPRNLILGIGCRRGTPREQIGRAVEDFMAASGKSPLSLKRIASVDIKKDEAGILEFSREQGLETCFVSRDAIAELEGSFQASEFVRQTLGVGGVAEPSALLCGTRARLVRGKTVYQGITLALAEEETVISL